MREMTRAIFEEFWTSDDEQMPTSVTRYREEFKQVDELLVRQPEVIGLVHGDLEAILKPQTTRDRTADFTSENLFRAILVMPIEGISYRETTIRIAESETLQNFCRLLKKKTVDHTLLCKAFCAIEPSTWETVNRLFAIRMKHEGLINPSDIRTDTTVTESNIHWPTDSDLLWDCYRVLERNIAKVREITSQNEVVTIRFHVKKVKKLHLDITRFSNSKDKKRRRQVRNWKKKLTKRVKQTVEKIKAVTQKLLVSTNMAVDAIGVELNAKLPLMEQAVAVAERNLHGEKVPACEKALSIFEPHTELIKRGRSAKSPARFRRTRAFARKKTNWTSCVRRWKPFRCCVGCVIWATS